MKKMLILVAVLLLPLSAMAGIAAFMNMNEANDQDLAQISGQTGISIEVTNLDQSIGQAGWEDGDGFVTATTLGAVVLATITMDNVALGEVLIDAGTSSTATTDKSFVSIACPAGIDQGTIDVAAVYVRAGIAAVGATETNLGRINLQNVRMTFDRIKISGHNVK